MIMRVVDDTTTLADREALAQWLKLSEITIRRHCRPAMVGRDSATGRALYDAEKAAEQVGHISGRRSRLATCRT